MTTAEKTKLKKIFDRNPKNPQALITVLQDIQKEFRYLPCDAMSEAAKQLGVPLSKVFSASTFYNAFSLKPRGETIIRICQGTACHINGADLMVEQLETELNLKVGETSTDLKFTIEVVNCVGACAMAPVLIVNETYHGNVRCDRAVGLAKKG